MPAISGAIPVANPAAIVRHARRCRRLEHRRRPCRHRRRRRPSDFRRYHHCSTAATSLRSLRVARPVSPPSARAAICACPRPARIRAFTHTPNLSPGMHVSLLVLLLRVRRPAGFELLETLEGTNEGVGGLSTGFIHRKTCAGERDAGIANALREGRSHGGGGGGGGGGSSSGGGSVQMGPPQSTQQAAAAEMALREMEAGLQADLEASFGVLEADLQAELEASLGVGGAATATAAPLEAAVWGGSAASALGETEGLGATSMDELSERSDAAEEAAQGLSAEEAAKRAWLAGLDTPGWGRGGGAPS